MDLLGETRVLDERLVLLLGREVDRLGETRVPEGRVLRLLGRRVD